MDSYCSVFEAAGNISPDEPTPSALGEAGEATISPSELAENAIDSIYEPKSTKCMPHILTQDQQSNATPSEVRDKESGCLQSGDEARMAANCSTCNSAELQEMGILEGEGTLCSTCGRPHTKRARQDIMKGPLPPDNWWSESMDAKFHLEIFTESSDLVPHFTEDCSDKLRKQLDLPTLFLSGANNRRSSLRSRPSASFNQFECCVDEKAVLIKMNKPTKDQWQALSPVIQRLYLDEGQTFKKVAEYLHKYHDFNPTKKQFTRRISEWGFHKNFKRDERQTILQRLGDDIQPGKFEAGMLRGRKLDIAKIGRWKKMEGLVCDSTVPTKAHPERFPVIKEPLKKQTRGSKLVSGGEASFACPFAKKDPLKYRSCNRYTLNRIRDVKQHLSRSHQPPIHCPRCMCVLGTESERDEHLRGSWCGVQDSIIFEGVTLAQKTQLAQRVPSTMTSEDQWFTIFEILFPDHTPKPRSAYKSVELTSEMEVFQDLIHAEGANIISTAIWSRGIHVASPSNAQCGSPGLLLAAIEDGLQQIIQRWSASMQVTPTDPSTSRVAAAKEASSSQMNQNIETADCLHRSPDPPQNKYQRANIPAESGLPAANQKCHQDEADEVGRLLLESGQEPPSWLDTIVDMHQFGESGQSDAMLHEAWSANQRNLEPMFNGNMEDGSDMWKGYNQGDFFN